MPIADKFYQRGESMSNLTYQKARAILAKHISEPHLLLHSLAVAAAMGERTVFWPQTKRIERRTSRRYKCESPSHFI